MAERDAPLIIDRLRTVFPEAEHVLDVGAGSGRFAAEARRRGIDVVAIERSAAGRSHARRIGVDAVSFDLGKTPAASLDGSFDLAYCFEVAEHVPEAMADRLVDFLAGFPRVLLSAASPGQGGVGHINEQPATYWEPKFDARGMVVDITTQRTFVRDLPLAQLSARWAITNIMLCRRSG